MTAKNLSGPLAAAINSALTPDGILVLATCGYYNEDPTRTNGKPYRLRDPNSIRTDAEYQRQWLENLGTMAAAIGRPAYADPTDSVPSANPSDAGSTEC